MGLQPDSASTRRAGPRTAVGCELRLGRARGREVVGRTIDVGEGGMRIKTTRPLAIDELLTFDVDLASAGLERHVDGKARVLREHSPGHYALRFEQLAPGCDRTLNALFAAEPGTSRPI